MALNRELSFSKATISKLEKELEGLSYIKEEQAKNDSKSIKDVFDECARLKEELGNLRLDASKNDFFLQQTKDRCFFLEQQLAESRDLLKITSSELEWEKAENSDLKEKIAKGSRGSQLTSSMEPVESAKMSVLRAENEDLRKKVDSLREERRQVKSSGRGRGGGELTLYRRGRRWRGSGPAWTRCSWGTGKRSRAPWTWMLACGSRHSR